MEQIHATVVEIDGAGVLFRGPSGSGKSDLALRLVDGGARLVADDRVDLRADGPRLYASAPENLAGLLEIRGVGIVEMPHVTRTPVVLVVDLTAPDAVERLPDEQSCALDGVTLPLIRLAPFEASAPAKLCAALAVARGIRRRRDSAGGMVRRAAS